MRPQLSRDPNLWNSYVAHVAFSPFFSRYHVIANSFSSAEKKQVVAFSCLWSSKNSKVDVFIFFITLRLICTT